MFSGDFILDFECTRIFMAMDFPADKSHVYLHIFRYLGRIVS